ncbi:MAG: ABC transporter substrate-binding protein [Candidatus Dependentiae bacterium]
MLTSGVQASFTTLNEFSQYADAMPEYPANDIEDWHNPVYSSFHKQMLPSLVQKVGDFFGFSTYKVFPIETFKKLLDEVEEYRQKTYSRGRLIQKMTPLPDSSFIIWGELNGAFHSFVRCLQELQQQGVIDNELNIVQPVTYFVFNGDVVNKSPYIIETMTLILQLMKKNPKKIFYLKGDYEDKQQWMQAGLGRELTVRAREFSTEKVPFADTLRNFFGTLPLALYLIPPEQTDKEKKVVRISFFGPEVNELDESDFPFFFDLYSKPIISLLQKTRQETDVSAQVAAYIYAEDRSTKYTHSNGLAFISKDKQNTQWSVVSSPTASFRRLYQFFDDAFVVLKTKEQLSDWTLTLYHQDVRTFDGFKKERPFYLISGEQIPDKQQLEITQLQDELVKITKENNELKEGCVLVQQEQPKQEELKKQEVALMPKAISALQDGNLVIGSTMDLSKQFNMMTRRFIKGLNLPIDQLNKQGGLNGIKLQMIYLDDGYEAKPARANIKKLLNDFKTNVVLSSWGTPVLTGYLDLVKEKKVLSIFPYTGAFHSSELEYLVHLRTSYYDNGRILGEYIANILQNPDKKIAFFYQDDLWGKDLIKGAKESFIKSGINNFLEISFIPNSLDLEGSVPEIKNFSPDAIALFGTPRICQELLNKLGADFLQKKLLFGDTILTQKEFDEFIKEKGLSVIRVQVTPNPEAKNLEIVQDFRKYAEKNKVPIDTVSLEGYMNATVFIEILQKIDGPLSIEAFLKTIEGIKDYNFKGLNLNFNPNNRQLLHTVWMNTGSDDWKPVKVHYDEDSVISKKPDIVDEIAL